MQQNDSCGDCAGLHRRQAGLYIHTALIFLSAYDHLYLLPLEIRYVWPSSLNLVTALYYTMKYGIIINSFVLAFRNFSPATLLNQCHITLPIYLVISQLCLWAGEALLGIRIWALWDRDPRLTFGLPIIHTALHAISFVNVGTFLRSISYKDSPVPHLPGCFVNQVKSNMRAAAVCMLIWVILMLILLLIPGFRAFRTGRNSQFVRRVFRDGILYYAYLIALHIVNLVIMIAKPLFLAGIPFFPVVLLHITLTSRIFLHTRHQANRQVVVLNQSNGEEMEWEPTASET